MCSVCLPLMGNVHGHNGATHTSSGVYAQVMPAQECLGIGAVTARMCSCIGGVQIALHGAEGVPQLYQCQLAGQKQLAR